MQIASFINFLNEKNLVILDGAIGTELQRRGYNTKLPLWSAEANIEIPDLVTQIHLDYFNAGSDLCITNTFRTTPRTYKKLNREAEALDSLKKAVSCALKAKVQIKRSVYCGGSLSPLEDCYSPTLVPSKTELEHEHGQVAKWLKEEGVDFLIAETINDKNEAAAMAKAASETGLPFIVSFITDKNGYLLDGSSLSEALNLTNYPERVAVSLNCREIDVIKSAFHVLKSKYNGQIGLYPNGFGKADHELGWVFEKNTDSAERFAKIGLSCNKDGAKIIGGCCGTTPEYIKKLSEAYKKEK